MNIGLVAHDSKKTLMQILQKSAIIRQKTTDEEVLYEKS